VVETGEKVSDSVEGAGFSRPLLGIVPAGGAILRAWAVDFERDRVYALAGGMSVVPRTPP
jgi:hypothetical protein